MDEKTKYKISKTLKGRHLSPRTEFKKGHKSSKETLQRVSEALTGRKLSTEHKRKISEAQKGKSVPSRGFKKGHKRSQETKDKISKKLKGCTSWKKGKTHNEDPRIPAGPNHPSWQGGITNIYILIRQRGLYDKWVKPILVHSNYTCQSCGKQGGQLDVHHDSEKMYDIIRKYVAMYASQYITNKKLIPYELKLKVVEGVINYHIENNVSGITLCRECHKDTYDFLTHSKLGG